MIAALALAVLAATGWTGDGGAPVVWEGQTIYLYGDSIVNGWFSQGTNVLVNGELLTDVAPDTMDHTVYWPGDAIPLPDGRLFVVLAEIAPYGNGTFEFTAEDADGFIVNDPTNKMSWKLAEKIEEGPWGDTAVEFSEQQPLAFSREPGEWTTTIYSYDPATPWTDWTSHGTIFTDDGPLQSFGTIVPVAVDEDTSYAVTYVWGNPSIVALYRSDHGMVGPYEWVKSLDAPGQTYNHALNVIDGTVTWRYSTLNGNVTYKEIDL